VDQFAGSDTMVRRITSVKSRVKGMHLHLIVVSLLDFRPSKFLHKDLACNVQEVTKSISGSLVALLVNDIGVPSSSFDDVHILVDLFLLDFSDSGDHPAQVLELLSQYISLFWFKAKCKYINLP
jgi:hypothetical protein